MVTTLRILDRRAQERLDRGERVERVMDQEILVRDLIEHLVGFVRRPQRALLERRVLQRRPVQLGEGVPVAEAEAIHRARHDVLIDLEVLDQDAQHALRHVGFHLQQRQRAVAQLLEAAVDRLEQVVRFVFLDHHVGVADDAEQVRALDLRAGEELLDVAADDVFEEAVRHAGLRRQVVGQRHEARQHARHLDARELRAPGMAHAHREVHAQVRDIRERVPRVERQRRQHGKDVILEVLGEPGIDRRRVFGRLEKVDALGGEQRPQRLAPARGLIVDLRQRARADGRQLLIGGLAVDRHLFDAGAEFLQDGGDAHHEELVEVGAGDGEELDALEQRVRRILRLREDALVERQPAQLAVDVERRAAEIVRVEVRPILQRLGGGATSASVARRLRGRRPTAVGEAIRVSIPHACNGTREPGSGIRAEIQKYFRVPDPRSRIPAIIRERSSGSALWSSSPGRSRRRHRRRMN